MADQEALRRFYMSRGYADFRVHLGRSYLQRGEGPLLRDVHARGGPALRFSAINIDSSLPGMNAAPLKGLVKTRPGRLQSSTGREDHRGHEHRAVPRGLSFAQVRPRGDRDYDEPHHRGHLHDRRGAARLHRADQHHRQYQDARLRHPSRIRRVRGRSLQPRPDRPGRARLRDLGFFKTVTITTEPGSAPDKVIINVYVEEQSTGEFSVGAGISAPAASSPRCR